MSHATVPELQYHGHFTCPRCRTLPIGPLGCYRCTHCKSMFCGECYTPNLADPLGRTLHCPHCGTTHRFGGTKHRTTSARPELQLLTDTPRPAKRDAKDWKLARDFLSTIPGTRV